jgi:hypothetical protein
MPRWRATLPLAHSPTLQINRPQARRKALDAWGTPIQSRYERTSLPRLANKSMIRGGRQREEIIAFPWTRDRRAPTQVGSVFVCTNVSSAPHERSSLHGQNIRPMIFYNAGVASFGKRGILSRSWLCNWAEAHERASLKPMFRRAAVRPTYASCMLT